MKLKKYEQSGFILETNSGFTIAWDIGSYTPTESIKIYVDAFIVSHKHGDHFSINNIKSFSLKELYVNKECKALITEELTSEIKTIAAFDTIEIGPAKVRYFTVNHGPNISAPVENLGFLIEVDNQKIYFCGDMFYEPKENISELEIDYLLLPVGTHYTFGPNEALSFAKKFKRVGTIIPMHYEKMPETRDEFKKLAEEKFNIKYL